ncbi:MAG: hypothetical protein QUV05_22815 [Phycisphaerae bacterium]|nr:hypothetical protein [Phycisphaerae bacterium]
MTDRFNDWQHLEIMARLQASYGGPGVEPPLADCRPARRDDDNDVDTGDFMIFRACLSGPDMVPGPACTC